MTLGELIKERRIGLGMKRSQLARTAGISHTEVQRIETGKRKNPSLKVLCDIAAALSLPQSDLLAAAGVESSGRMSAFEMAFPGLVTANQREVIEKIAGMLQLNHDLSEADLCGLPEQVEMYIDFANKKRILSAKAEKIELKQKQLQTKQAKQEESDKQQAAKQEKAKKKITAKETK